MYGLYCVGDEASRQISPLINAGSVNLLGIVSVFAEINPSEDAGIQLGRCLKSLC